MLVKAKELKNQIKKGIFSTMRNYEYKVGAVVTLRDENRKEIGKAKVLAVFVNCKAFRKPLLKYSGFKSIEEWKQKAIELHGSMPKFIVLCKVL